MGTGIVFFGGFAGMQNLPAWPSLVVRWGHHTKFKLLILKLGQAPLCGCGSIKGPTAEKTTNETFLDQLCAILFSQIEWASQKQGAWKFCWSFAMSVQAFARTNTNCHHSVMAMVPGYLFRGVASVTLTLSLNWFSLPLASGSSSTNMFDRFRSCKMLGHVAELPRSEKKPLKMSVTNLPKCAGTCPYNS